MKQLSKKELGDSSNVLNVVVPIAFQHDEQPDINYLIRVASILDSAPSYRYFQEHSVTMVRPETCTLEKKFLYEGDDDFYEFGFDFELVVVENHIVLTGNYSHTENGLLDQFIREKVLPEWCRVHGFEVI